MRLGEKRTEAQELAAPETAPPQLPATAYKEGQGLLGALGTVVYSLNTCRTPGSMRHQVQT